MISTDSLFHSESQAGHCFSVWWAQSWSSYSDGIASFNWAPTYNEFTVIAVPSNGIKYLYRLSLQILLSNFFIYCFLLRKSCKYFKKYTLNLFSAFYTISYVTMFYFYCNTQSAHITLMKVVSFIHRGHIFRYPFDASFTFHSHIDKILFLPSTTWGRCTRCHTK